MIRLITTAGVGLAYVQGQQYGASQYLPSLILQPQLLVTYAKTLPPPTTACTATL